MASATTPAGDPNVPVNIAPPNWQCPHCRTQYRDNLDKATACAAAGPPPPAVEGTPVLSFIGSAGGGLGSYPRGSDPVFGLTKLGPIKRTTVDGQLRHRQDVIVAGRQVDADTLVAAPEAADGLRIIAYRHTGQTTRPPSEADMTRWGLVSKLFLTPSSRYSSSPEVRVWSEPNRNYYRGNERSWLLPPNDEERAALNVVTAGLLDRVAEADETTLVERVTQSYNTVRSFREGHAPAALIGPASGLMVADAHGASNHIWALRWLSAHLDDVVAWQVTALRSWASGTGEPFPLGVNLQTPSTLPKNPGKKRLAVMEPFGWDYQQVITKITAGLVVDTPTRPIPHLGNVDAFIRGAEGAHHV